MLFHRYHARMKKGTIIRLTRYTMKESENESGVIQTSFALTRESMTKVLEAYQEAKRSGEYMTSIDLHDFPSMIEIVRQAEKENIEGALSGEEFKRIENSPEFIALANSAAGAKAIKKAHIYKVRQLLLDEFEREGKEVAELKQMLARDVKDNQDK